VKLKSRKKRPKKKRKGLDKVLENSVYVNPKDRGSRKHPPLNPTKKKRGRPRKMERSWVTGRASNSEFQLNQVWANLEAPLLAAQTAEEVTIAFTAHGEPYARDYVPGLAADILTLVRDKKFPKRPAPRIKFLARSLAGRPSLSFRTSRDLCEMAQIQESLKSPHRVLRQEFYIECSCGYQGPARDNACRKCGASIPPFGLLTNSIPI